MSKSVGHSGREKLLERTSERNRERNQTRKRTRPHLCDLIHYSRTLMAVTKALMSSFASFSFSQLHSMLSDYLSRLSVIVDSKLNCGPVLTWMEVQRAHASRILQLHI